MADTASPINTVGEAFVAVGADLNPLEAALGGLGQKLTGPIGDVTNHVKSVITGSFQNLGQVWGQLLGFNIGGAVELAGTQAAALVGSTVNRVLTAVLGDTVGGTLGGLIERTVTTAGEVVSGTVGKLINAVVRPVQQAFVGSLTDFDRWVAEAIKDQEAQTRFGAVLQATGNIAGWSGDQLQAMAAQLSELTGNSRFSADAFRDVQSTLLQFQDIRGDTFFRTLAAAADMASATGQDLNTTVRQLGMALSAPETAGQRLRRMFVVLSEDQKKAIKDMVDAGNVTGAQAQVLDIIEGKYKGVGAAMADTTLATLGTITSLWSEVGESIGNVFLPGVKLVADGARSVVQWLYDVTGPILGGLAERFQGVADGVRGWFGQNAPVFQRWADLLEVIFQNVVKLATEGFGRLFDLIDPGRAQGFWESVSGGVTTALEEIALLTSDWELFEATLKQVWEAAKSYVLEWADTARESLADFLLEGWEKIKPWAQQAWDWFLEKAKLAFDLIVAYAQEQFPKLAALLDLPDRIARNVEAGLDNDLERLGIAKPADLATVAGEKNISLEGDVGTERGRALMRAALERAGQLPEEVEAELTRVFGQVAEVAEVAAKQAVGGGAGLGGLFGGAAGAAAEEKKWLDEKMKIAKGKDFEALRDMAKLRRDEEIKANKERRTQEKDLGKSDAKDPTREGKFKMEIVGAKELASAIQKAVQGGGPEEQVAKNTAETAKQTGLIAGGISKLVDLVKEKDFGGGGDFGFAD